MSPVAPRQLTSGLGASNAQWTTARPTPRVCAIAVRLEAIKGYDVPKKVRRCR
jgi:hypothetical protein